MIVAWCTASHQQNCRVHKKLTRAFHAAENMIPLINAKFFWSVAETLVPSMKADTAHATKVRRFRVLFGVSSPICCRLWHLVKSSLPNGASPRHLLWTLYFLRQYSDQEVNSAFAKCDEKTFRKWCWIVIKALADLDLVSVCCCFTWCCSFASLTNFAPYFVFNFLPFFCVLN
jgi:hypothetical protein